jgi:hypothetical protein
MAFQRTSIVRVDPTKYICYNQFELFSLFLLGTNKINLVIVGMVILLILEDFYIGMMFLSYEKKPLSRYKSVYS